MKRRITFASFGPKIASSRLRAEIPQRELASLGIEAGRDVLVIGKHGWEWDKATKGFARVVYDVCDDHFGDNLSAHYLGACARADAVTCNSHVMRDIVKAKTGRDAWVIPDPWESPECAPRTGRSLLWFGHRRNLRDVTPWLDKLAGRDLTIVTKLQGDEPVIGGVRWVEVTFRLGGPEAERRAWAIGQKIAAQGIKGRYILKRARPRIIAIMALEAIGELRKDWSKK